MTFENPKNPNSRLNMRKMHLGLNLGMILWKHCSCTCKDRGLERCRTSEVKYMGAWHRVSNKNQPNISSIKFLKNRDFFYSRTTTTSIVELSPSSTSPIERVSQKKSSCKTVSQGVLKFRRLVQLSISIDSHPC